MKPQRAILLLLVLCTALTPALADRARVSRGDGPGLARLQQMGYNGPVLKEPAAAQRLGGGVTLWVAPPPLGSNANDGLSSTTPMGTIQFAISQASANGADTVRVLAGTYNECINNTAFAIGAQLNLAIVADDWLVNNNAATTIIDGNGACAAPFSVVNLAGTGTPGSRLEGFTITNAADSGVFVIGSGVVTSNVITSNTGLDGGGIFAYPGTCYYGAATIQLTNNTITNNTADDQGSCNPGGEPCSIDSQCPTTGATCAIFGGNGGGVYVRGASVNSGGTIGCIGGDARVEVTSNVIDGNGADFAFGGGLYAKTDAQTGRLSTVAISQNLISNNTTLALSLGYGGGAWVGTFGYGTEQIDFDDNTVSSNTTTGDGGGVSAWVDTQSAGDHTINVTNNDVVTNTAAGAGGGLDLFQISREVSGGKGVLNVTDNLIDGNDAQGTELATFSPGLGGGAVINAWSEETFNALSGINFRRNEVTNNTTLTAGGGVAAIIRADADHDDDGGTNDARSDASVSNNLIALNSATDTNAVGGGIFAFVHGEGGDVFPALSTLSMDNNTVAQNTSTNGTGAIEIESYTILDANSMDAETVINLRDSIIYDNSDYGVGGPALGGNPLVSVPDWAGRPNTSVLTITNRRNNIFMNPDGDYDTTLPVETDVMVSNDQLGTDPLLDTTFIPTVCSPTIDAGQPANPPGNEPAPNGGAFNLGHTGGTALAAKTLADVTPSGGMSDGIVDGWDVLQLAVAFASTNGDTRFNAAVDFDGDGFVGPIDLVLLAANYGVNCN